MKLIRDFLKPLPPLFIILIVLSFAGCGGNDLLDERGDRYILGLTISDGDEEPTSDIDVVRATDCTGDGTGEPEDNYTNVYGTISVTVDTNVSGLELLGYTVTFIPLDSPTSIPGVYLTPPALQPKVTQISSFFPPTGTTATQQVLIMTVSQKEIVAAGLTPTCQTLLYQIIVDVRFKEVEGEEEITKTFYEDVWMFNVNRC
jgi:hypothetical protein